MLVKVYRGSQKLTHLHNWLYIGYTPFSLKLNQNKTELQNYVSASTKESFLRTLRFLRIPNKSIQMEIRLFLALVYISEA